MCGIAGYIGQNKIENYKVQNVLESMSTRGPDHQDYFYTKIKNKHIYLFHSRLSIINLKKNSNQPFKIGNKILIFNGEIYNYLELREKLKSKNHKFSTKSDTEVLLRMYIEYGDDCYDMLEGMWSFAIWNGDKNQLVLSRDRFGEKPLFYSSTDNNFYFGSEIKFIKKISNHKLLPNNDLWERTLRFGYRAIFKSNENSYYKNVSFLKPHHNLLIDSNMRIKKEKYWEPKFKLNKDISYNEAKMKVRELLIKSMELRLRADVNVAFSLSGGIDSSILSAISSKLLNYPTNSFSIIDHDKKYNELENILANTKSNNIKKNFIKIKSKNFLQNLFLLAKFQEYPLFTITAYVHNILMNQVSKKNYRVCILGSGADEIFSGYLLHFNYLFRTIKNLKKDDNYISWKKFIYPNLRNPIFKRVSKLDKKNFSNKINFNNKELRNILKSKYDYRIKDNNYSSDFFRNKLMIEAFEETIPVLMYHDDINAMNNSVENRSPYLDRNLYEFVNTLPSSFLSKNGYLKYILRDAFNDIVPNKVLWSREKKGFNFELSNLCNFKDKNIYDNFFDNKTILNSFIDKKKLYAVIKESKNVDLNKFLFNLINMKFFYEINQ